VFQITYASGDSALSRSFSDLRTVGEKHERCLLDDELPLTALTRQPRGVEIVFALRRRPVNFPPQYRSFGYESMEPALIPIDGGNHIHTV
jgi:hypothetical protein